MSDEDLSDIGTAEDRKHWCSMDRWAAEILPEDSDVTPPEATETGHETFREEIRELARDNFETLLERNQAYGMAFEKTGRLEQERGGYIFDNHYEAVAYGLMWEADIKLQRAYEHLFRGDVDPKEAEEAALDCANYGLLLAWTARQMVME